MKYVQTVTGPLETSKIGFSLMHEHVVASAAGIPENYPELYVKGYYEKALKDLKDLKANGIELIVDTAPYDLGRDPRTLKELAEKSGMNIVATTGFFMDLSPMLGNYTPDDLAACMIKDLKKGMSGTDIKAGMIKGVMDMEGPTKGREIQHRAAAIASNETGTPVFMHTLAFKQTARFQLEFLKAEGIDMNRVKVDHCLETTDLDYIKWIADQGVWLGVERLPCLHLPHEHGVATETRIKMVKQMIDAGMADQMLLSHDTGVLSTMWNTKSPEELEFIESLAPQHWLFIKDYVIVKLLEMGVDETVLNKICYENPRRFFEGC